MSRHLATSALNSASTTLGRVADCQSTHSTGRSCLNLTTCGGGDGDASLAADMLRAVAAAWSRLSLVGCRLRCRAAEPEFAGMSPYGFQRGTEIETTFRGIGSAMPSSCCSIRPASK